MFVQVNNILTFDPLAVSEDATEISFIGADFNELKSHQFVDFCGKINKVGHNVVIFNLKDTNIVALFPHEWTLFFQAISQPVEELNLDYNNLGAYKDDLPFLFLQFSRSLKTLRLSCNDLPSDMSNAFDSLGKDLVTLDLDNNAFGDKNIDEFAQSLQILSTNGLSEINLSENQFGSMKIPKNFSKITKSLNNTITSVNLFNNELNLLGYVALADGIKNLSGKAITNLHLGMNYLGAFSSIELRLIIEAISTNIRNLDLSSNSLGLHGAHNAFLALKYLSPNVNTLNLSDNLLSEGDVQNLRDMFANFSTREFYELNLSNNNLGGLDPIYLNEIVKYASTSSIILNLARNTLNHLTKIELKQLFKNVSNRVWTLDVSGNELENMHESFIDELLFTLPESPLTVIFAGNKKIKVSDFKNQLFTTNPDKYSQLLHTYGLFSQNPVQQLKPLEIPSVQSTKSR